MSERDRVEQIAEVMREDCRSWEGTYAWVAGSITSVVDAESMSAEERLQRIRDVLAAGVLVRAELEEAGR